MSTKRRKAMILNHIFHIFTATGVATMTSKGPVSHILLLLSVQCNTLHGTEYIITCGVFVCVRVCVCVCARAQVLRAEYLENG